MRTQSFLGLIGLARTHPAEPAPIMAETHLRP